MKTKLPLFFACLLITSSITTFKSMAQEPTNARPYPAIPRATPNYPGTNRFSFRLYSAPDGGYGYDIFKDQKLVFHQFVLMVIDSTGKRFFATKQQAQKAASLATGKMKNGMSPTLTATEIKKIAAEQISN